MSGQYLLELINDTLDMNRIESGKLELHPIVYDGKAMINHAIRLGKTSLKGKNINVKLDVDAMSSLYLYVDVSRFEQVMMNVFGNAVKFTPEGGTIELILHNHSINDGILTSEMIIRDSGIGISPEFLPHIFDAFSQENASKTGPTQGTGLGMAITKQIIHLMGGDIRVESELGKGTAFFITFRLPLATDEQVNEWKQTQLDVEHTVLLTGRHILLCEDHPLNTKIAIRLLEAKGMTVDHAENGQIGVNMFRHSKPGYYDAILMDIRMPVMDGLQAAQCIRALSRPDAKTIPILAMTANAFADDIEQTMGVGMNAHLSKPIQTNVMYQTLSEQIASRKV